MRVRTLVSAALAASFAGIVVEAAATNQCPASGLGACARIHLELMRPRTPMTPIVLAAEPMRAAARQG